MQRFSLEYSVHQLGMEFIPQSLGDQLMDGAVPIRWGPENDQTAEGTIVGVRVADDGQSVEFTIEVGDEVVVTDDMAARQLGVGVSLADR